MKKITNDLTKCSGENCPIKNRCHRYTASPDEYQSYFMEMPCRWNYDHDPATFQCDMFWGDDNEQVMNHLKMILDGHY